MNLIEIIDTAIKNNIARPKVIRYMIVFIVDIFFSFQKEVVYLKRILKQTFVIIITFVLVFAISIPCFADDVKKSPAGFNSWSTQEKVNYLGNTAAQIISSVTGLVSGSGGDGFKQLCLDLYANQPEAGVYSYYEYLANGLSFDDDTETWTLSDDLADFCNQLIVNYNDKVTMMYRYPLNKANIDASKFPNKVFYDAFIDLLNAFPDYYFFFTSTDCQNPNFMIDGKRNNFGYSYRVQVVKPFSGVNAYPDLVTTPVTLYNDNWETAKYSVFWIISSDNFKTSESIRYFDLTSYDGYNNFNYGNYFESLDALKSTGFAFVGGSGAKLSMCNQFSWSRTFTDLNTPYSASDVPINVYKTVADMKKDIGSQVVGKYTPDYTGTASNTVTQNTVNNVTNNYYGDNSGGGSGGGSSGSDNSGGGSSGGGIFDDIISGIANGVGSIIKGVFSIIKDLVDAIADAIVSITKSITDLMGLLKGDFTSFLSAVFPFMPQEFIKIMVASLALCLLGVIIKIFRG